MNFRLARDQIMHLETASNLWASRRKTNDFFTGFFLPLSWEVYQNTYWLAPRETVSFDSPRPQNLFCCSAIVNYLSTASLLFLTVPERDLDNLPVKFWTTRRFVLKELDHPLDLYAWCLTYVALSSTITWSSPTMPRHIRDFYVTFARKFKLNNDFSCSDNKKNGRYLPTESMFCAITSLLVKFRKSLHMAFEDDTSIENTRPFLRFYRC